MTPVVVTVYHRVDPAEEAADIAACERDLEKLRFARPRDLDHAITIQYQIAACERGLARMKGEKAT